MKGVNRLARGINLPNASTPEQRADIIRRAGEAAQADANARSIDQWLIKRGKSITHVERAYLKATDRILCRVPPKTGTRIDDTVIAI